LEEHPTLELGRPTAGRRSSLGPGNQDGLMRSFGSAGKDRVE
jgi:hypothetical protein